MPLLGFTMFKEEVLSGQKDQTIRKPRKIPIKVSDRLYLYWKLRTKQCEKLGEAICTETFIIRITYRYRVDNPSATTIWIPREPSEWGAFLSEDQMADLARRDGFDSAEDMVRTLMKLHDHVGAINWTESFQVIRWGRLEKKET
jgi:hypothetical protein